jgi:acetyl-CoA carboxylase biotin carboxylase subunit
MFDKILIANRGEIAVRVVRACRSLGIRSAAIYSEADRDALHVRLADEAVACGPARAAESYLDAGRIVEIAKRLGADALHPGYGFLSENADFAERVEAAGITFIGPSPKIIRSMGLKVAARERMRAAGVAIVPGGEEIVSARAAREAASELGYPIFVKASAGGGGRGMRRVENEDELEAALGRATSEAEAVFGNGAIYLEKCLLAARHIEIQLIADGHGHVVHLGERECSIQRRHQKLVEEAPAYGMTDALRATMGEAAVRAAKAVGYEGAGTCEFLVDKAGDFFFLEMNTRIQVEHPVTEAVTGLDLVDLQIRIAAGETLPFTQDDISLKGHAIEARIYAEDPDKGFLPSAGRMVGWSLPSGAGIRLDSGFESGQTVTAHYDPMIAKLIVSGRDRKEALERFADALEAFWIAGIRTGLPFLRRLVENPVFRSGCYDTNFLENEMSAGLAPLDVDLRDLVFAAVAHRASVGDVGGGKQFRMALPKQEDVGVEISSWSNPIRARVNDRDVEFEFSDAEGSITDLVRGELSTRMTIIERRRGGFDVGLRDRVLLVTCEVDEAPSPPDGGAGRV